MLFRSYFGIGAFYYEPFAQGTALRYIGTEGQGIPGGGSYYNLFALSFPIGGSINYHITKDIKFGIDVSYKWTSTDYLDDVSGNYFDKSKIAEIRGETAAYLSDPSSGKNPSWTSTGEQRGDPKWRDGFMFAIFKVTYMPLKKSNIKSTKKKKSNKSFVTGKTKGSNKRSWWMY